MERFHHINKPLQARGIQDWFIAKAAKKRHETIPVFMNLADCTEAVHLVEKDGTGIGTGADREYRPVLGGSYDLAQDVAPEQGCSTNSENGFHGKSYGSGRYLHH